MNLREQQPNLADAATIAALQDAIPQAPLAQPPIQAVQHIRRMRGGAQSQLIRASDGFFYVVKFQNNPQHVRVLANELFVTRLAQKLSIPVPEPALIEVSQWLIEHTDELQCNLGTRKVPFASGLCFGSRHVVDPERDEVTDYLPDHLLHKVCNLNDFARMLVLDKWACNSDGRQCVFTRRSRAHKYRATFIDHGYCFNAGEWTFPDAPLRGIYSSNAAYSAVTGWKSFEPALSRAQEMTIDNIAECSSGMPEEWYEKDSDALARMIEMLYRRRAMITDLINTFRQYSRNPFPNWKAR